jgi:hypothetical protein
VYVPDVDARELDGFTVESIEIVFRGVCAACTEINTPPTEPRSRRDE